LVWNPAAAASDGVIKPEENFQGYMENMERANQEAQDYEALLERHRVSTKSQPSLLVALLHCNKRVGRTTDSFNIKL